MKKKGGEYIGGPEYFMTLWKLNMILDHLDSIDLKPKLLPDGRLEVPVYKYTREERIAMSKRRYEARRAKRVRLTQQQMNSIMRVVKRLKLSTFDEISGPKL